MTKPRISTEKIQEIRTLGIHPLIDDLIDEVTHLRKFIRDLHFDGHTGEDANDFIMGTLDSCEAEIAAWGENPDAAIEAHHKEVEEQAAKRHEDHERAELQRLQDKYRT